MKHTTTADFRIRFTTLPSQIQELAEKNFEILKRNPRHPSLHFKKVGKYYSVRVGRSYRAIGLESQDDTIIWFWIGTHAAYDKELG